MKSVRLYKAIAGKKMNLIGEGSSVLDAINDAEIVLLDYDYDDEEDYNQALVDYVLAAHQDYVLERD